MDDFRLVRDGAEQKVVIVMGGDDKNDDDAGVKDGGRHDVGRDGETGKTADDIDPSKYGKRENDDK